MTCADFNSHVSQKNTDARQKNSDVDQKKDDRTEKRISVLHSWVVKTFGSGVQGVISGLLKMHQKVVPKSQRPTETTKETHITKLQTQGFNGQLYW